MISSIIELIDQILYIFIPNFQISRITLLVCNVKSESFSLNDNIFLISGKNSEGSTSDLNKTPDNNEGPANSNNNNPDNNEEPTTSSNNNQENPHNSNLNDDNNEDSNSNSNSDSNSDYDDSENNSTEEINDLEYNGPERIMDDLDMIDKARNNDPEALEYLAKEYKEFFEDTSKEDGLDLLEHYLEKEFPGEFERSELEADAIEATEKAEDLEGKANRLEKKAEDTTDPQKKEKLYEKAEDLRGKAAGE